MADPHIRELLEESARHVGHAAPFVVGAMQKAPELSRTRIIEAVIIAVVIGSLSAGFTMFVALPQIRLEMAYLKDRIGEVKNDVHEIRRDLMNQKSSDQNSRRYPVFPPPFPGN